MRRSGCALRNLVIRCRCQRIRDIHCKRYCEGVEQISMTDFDRYPISVLTPVLPDKWRASADDDPFLRRFLHFQRPGQCFADVSNVCPTIVRKHQTRTTSEVSLHNSSIPMFGRLVQCIRSRDFVDRWLWILWSGVYLQRNE